MDEEVFDIPIFTESAQLDEYASFTEKSDDNDHDGETKTEKLTKKAAKESVIGVAEMITSLVGTATRTNASLSPLEYEDVADKLAPVVLKVMNSEGGLPKWVEQLLNYSPYFMAGFGVLMFGVSVRAKVLDEKIKMAKASKKMKDVNPMPKSTDTKEDDKKGADNGDKSK